MVTIQKLKVSIMPPILKLINSVIDSGTFPTILKINKIVPIRKNSDLDDLNPEKYRPVNLVSSLSKLIEKAWHKQIVRYLIRNKKIPFSHQGSIKIGHQKCQCWKCIKKHQEIWQRKKTVQ